MKTVLRVILVFSLFVVFYTCFVPIACAETIASGNCGSLGDNITWRLDSNGELNISGTGNMLDYDAGVTPWENNRNIITTIILNEGVNTIGNNAFRDCINLSYVALPESLTTIGDESFCRCRKLSEMTIPKSVTQIGVRAFRGCNLISVTIPGSISKLEIMAFYECKNMINVTISEGVERISGSAFGACSKLSQVTIPQSVKTIEVGAFRDCSDLESIIIPEGVTSIGDLCFADCPKLCSISLPASLTNIGGDVFLRCKKLAEIIVNDDNQNYCDVGGVLCDKEIKTIILCPNGILGEFIIPKSVTTIVDGAFQNCSDITSVVFPEGVKNIGTFAFLNCVNLNNVTLPSSISEITYGVFKGCVNLTSVTISEGSWYIGASVFEGCNSLMNITIPESVTYIERGAFSGCGNLKVVCYNGTEEDRENITINNNNYALLAASWYYNGSMPNIITISYKTDYGYGTMRNQLALSGESIVLLKNDFKRDNFSFSGWVDQNNNTYSQMETIIPLEDLILTAKWERISYSIEFEANGGNGTMSSHTVRVGNSLVIPDCSFTNPSGKMFLEWNTEADGKGTIYKAGDLLTPTDDVVLYAQWAVVCAISFYPNGGNGDYQTQTVPKDIETKMKTISELGFVAPSGMSFVGWNTKADGSGVSYSDGASICVVDDLSLYAIWIAKPDFVLPDSLVQIGEEAFVGGAFTYVKLSEQTKSIGRLAFADCPNLKYIYIPEATTSIDRYAFVYVNGLTILGKAGSEAEIYAHKYNFTFIHVL